MGSLVFADGRTSALPRGWTEVNRSTLDHVRDRLVDALTRVDTSPSGALVDAVRSSLLDLTGDTDPDHVERGDLWAADLHGARVSVEAAAALLLPGVARTVTARKLHEVAAHPPLTDVTAHALESMWDLREELRSVAGACGGREAGATADVLAAVKRPGHFPLLPGEALDAWWFPHAPTASTAFDAFARRIQTMAFVHTDQHVRAAVSRLRESLKTTTSRAVAYLVDAADDLRLLSALLPELGRQLPDLTASSHRGG